MCGIIGNFGDVPRKELLFYWDMLSHRGTDSFGIISKKGSKYFTKKGLFEEYVAETIKDAEFTVAHNRWASIGDKADVQLAHPVKYKDIYVVHNGTNRHLYNSVSISKSDTHAIAIIYDKLKDKKDIKYFLKDIGIVFIFDTKKDTLVFYKDTTRPLYYSKKLKMFASEPVEVGSWRMIKNQFKILNANDIASEWKSKIELNKKSISLKKDIKMDICNVCLKEKLMNEDSDICPDCLYNNRKQKEWKTNWNNDDTSWSSDVYYRGMI